MRLIWLVQATMHLRRSEISLQKRADKTEAELNDSAPRQVDRGSCENLIKIPPRRGTAPVISSGTHTARYEIKFDGWQLIRMRLGAMKTV